MVIDDHGKRPAEPVVAAFAGALDIRCLRLERNAGPATARNTGAEVARGASLVFLDDDCVPAAGWLTALAARLGEGGPALLGGPARNAAPANPWSVASHCLLDYLAQRLLDANDRPAFFPSCNMALPTALFHRLGGFDPTFPSAAAEDRELCHRAAARGVPLRFVPDAAVGHSHELSALPFLRQHFAYGRGAWRFRRIVVDRGESPPRLEPWRFYRDLVLFPFTRHQRLPAALGCSLRLALSQAANALGFFWEATR